MKKSEAEWKEYVQMEAEDYGVPFDVAWELFSILGESEAYDGFIVALEDSAEFNL